MTDLAVFAFALLAIITLGATAVLVSDAIERRRAPGAGPRTNRHRRKDDQ